MLDADIVISAPQNFEALWKYETRSQKLSSPKSDKIRKYFEIKQREISTLLKYGKVIIVFIYPIKGFNGEVNNKGYYESVTNYDFLPGNHDFLFKNLKSGKSINSKSLKLSNPNAIFAQYFKAFKDELEYSAYLDVESNEYTSFISNKSDKPVAFTRRIDEGLIVYLPEPKYESHNKKFLNTIITCTKKILVKYHSTPPPEWISKYNLLGEDYFDSEINLLNVELQKILDKQQELEMQKKNISKFKTLLYEQGPNLELIVIESFILFGFNAENRKVADLEHDVVFYSDEGKGIAEIEGKDNDSINVHKLDQLNRAVDEDFDLTETFSQGILIGNHFRLTDPNHRKEPFTTKVHLVAKKKNFGLLSTFEIFKAVQRIIENPNDINYRETCRKSILNTTGELIKLT